MPRANSLQRQLRCTSPSMAATVVCRNHDVRRPKARQSGRSCIREPSNAEISERANSELLKRADTAAIEAASINRRMHQPSNGQVDRMYPPELLRVEAAECRRGAIGMSPRVGRTLLALAERLESQATILEARESADRRQEIMRDLPKS